MTIYKRNGLYAVISAMILYSLLPSLSCVKEEKKEKGEFLFSIDDREYDLTSVLFDYRRTMSLAEQSRDSGREKKDRVIRQNFIVQYINEELLYIEAKRRGIKVDDYLVENELREMKWGHTDMTFGTYLSSMMLTESTLKEKIARRLIIEKLINSLVKEGDISDEDVEIYYASHRDEFKRPALCRMRQIVIKSLSEAQNVIAQLKKGASFEELAQNYSESPESVRGGDLGFLPEDSIDENFKRECHNLREGEVSRIIEAPDGYRIYMLVKYLPPSELPLEIAKREIRVRLLEERKEQEKNNLLRRLRLEHKIVINENLLDKLE